MAKKESAEKAVREIRRETRRRFSAEEKIRIVIEALPLEFHCSPSSDCVTLQRHDQRFRLRGQRVAHS